MDCVITSPPYWGLRDYGVEGQIGLEKHPQEYISKMVRIFGEVKKVLKPTGSVWLNVGDTYCGAATSSSTGKKDFGKIRKGYPIDKSLDGKGCSPNHKNIIWRNPTNWLQPKQKMLMPHRLAIAMQEDGWILRNDIVWHKPSHMPSSVKDRLTNSFEYLFHFVQKRKYFYDLDAIREEHKTGGVHKRNKKWALARGQKESESLACSHPSGKNPADVWSINPKPYPEAHFACYPPALVEKPLKATCPKDGVVLDPFIGSGTTLQVAQEMRKNGIGIELNPEYIKLIEKRVCCTQHKKGYIKKLNFISGTDTFEVIK